MAGATRHGQLEGDGLGLGNARASVDEADPNCASSPLSRWDTGNGMEAIPPPWRPPDTTDGRSVSVPGAVQQPLGVPMPRNGAVASYAHLARLPAGTARMLGAVLRESLKAGLPRR